MSASSHAASSSAAGAPPAASSSAVPASSSSSAAASGAGAASAPSSGPLLNSDLIQQYLDENQLMLAAIIEHQNAGKLEATVKFQQKLQQNLMYLAMLADQNRNVK